MEQQDSFFNVIRIRERKPITPEDVRGLSLGELTELHGTEGLLVRAFDTLERPELNENKMILKALQLGLEMHKNDTRTNGHYADHLLRTMLHLIETLEITDPDMIAVMPLHDVVEDHARDLVFYLTGEWVEDEKLARALALELLEDFTNKKVSRLVSAVSNPILQPGENKQAAYEAHVKHLVETDPEARIIKLADFIDNGVGNHATRGNKQNKLDKRYLPLFDVHLGGLDKPDNQLSERARNKARNMLTNGYERAKGRQALRQAQRTAA